MRIFPCLVASAFALAGCVGDPPAAATPAAGSATYTLQRTPCFGACPSYTVTVSPEGEVNFSGTRFVQAIGERHGQIDAAHYAAIAEAARVANLRALRDNYESGAGCDRWHTDAPGLKLTQSDAQGTKTVAFNFGCEGTEAQTARVKLEALATTIDAQAGTAQWVGTQGR